MMIAKSPIDRRPFRSKAECRQEETLEKYYQKVAIREVVAVLPKKSDKPTKST